MRKLFAAVTAAAFVVALGAPAFAKEATIKGEVVDQTCYMKDHAKTGEAHKDCAATCAKKGAPMAILTEDGKLYQITGGLAEDSNRMGLVKRAYLNPIASGLDLLRSSSAVASTAPSSARTSDTV